MPVGRPTDDGEIVLGSRHSTRHGTLGTLAIWKCPACGKQNDARKPEQGCAHCGAGDPLQSKAGTVETRESRPPVEDGGSNPPGEPAHRAPTGVGRGADLPPAGTIAPVEPTRILRLIEYLILPGQDARETLRRSLVGTIHMGWGQITGTIVDSVDLNQEDRLRLAKLQPGVWLANPGAVSQQDPHAAITMRPMVEARREFVRVEPRPLDFSPGPPFSIRKEPAMTIPNTGPVYSKDQENLATVIAAEGGLKLANTLALALGNIATELQGNSEPEKFLTSEECTQLANALLQQIPDDWQGEGPGEIPPPTEADEQSRIDARKRAQAIVEASKPTATPWIDPETRKGKGVLDA